MLPTYLPTVFTSFIRFIAYVPMGIDDKTAFLLLFIIL